MTPQELLRQAIADADCLFDYHRITDRGRVLSVDEIRSGFASVIENVIEECRKECMKEAEFDPIRNPVYRSTYQTLADRGEAARAVWLQEDNPLR